VCMGSGKVARGCMDMIFITHHVVEKSWNMHYCAFVDFEKAYDLLT